MPNHRDGTNHCWTSPIVATGPPRGMGNDSDVAETGAGEQRLSTTPTGGEDEAPLRAAHR